MFVSFKCILKLTCYFLSCLLVPVDFVIFYLSFFAVLGCPNLSLTNVMSRRNICSVGTSSIISMNTTIDHWDVPVPGVDNGSLYFAVSGRGAYARSLTMPFGAAIETQVQLIK